MIRLLADRPMSKAELAGNLGHKTVSGQLNKVVRLLVEDGTIEFTTPDKPHSRLLKYRLTARGKAVLANSMRGDAET